MPRIEAGLLELAIMAIAIKTLGMAAIEIAR